MNGVLYRVRSIRERTHLFYALFVIGFAVVSYLLADSILSFALVLVLFAGLALLLYSFALRFYLAIKHIVDTIRDYRNRNK
ncbi:MAG TPA: hypothetical protein VJL58_02645 [Pyrinomonadaceae bacterium]|nr:hypothetical protein [Pyrinomonadaceae bacterium]